MADYIVRVIAREAGVRGLACVTTEVVKEGARRHRTAPTATLALGRALTAAALMGALLKVRQRVALKFTGDGPLEKIITEGDSYGRVRGYVQRPNVNLQVAAGTDPVDRAIGQGNLTVVKDLQLKDLAEGVVPLATGDIANDLAFYLNQSEQNLSAVELGVVLNDTGAVQTAGGLLIQELPSHKEKESAIHILAERIQEMPPLEEALREGKTPEDVLARVFGGVSYDVLEQRPLMFKCSCSWERSEKALVSLGREELEALLQEGQAVVDCHFCHERYVFSAETLEDLIAQFD